MNTLGENIRYFREQNGLSMLRLADRAEVSVSTVFDLEHGKRRPRMSTLKLIAHSLGVTVERLLEERR